MRILIADDESIIRMGLKKMLEEMGHQVVAAPDGLRALKLARYTKPDLAILDIKMPEMDGLEVARILHEERPIPIIILTAYSDKELVEQAKEAAVMAYLVKPIRETELAPALEIAVARFQERHQLQEEAGKLKESLRARKVIEAAKRVLMQRGMSEAEAFMFIHRRSRFRRRPMKEVAQEILRSEGA